MRCDSSKPTAGFTVDLDKWEISVSTGKIHSQPGLLQNIWSGAHLSIEVQALYKSMGELFYLLSLRILLPSPSQGLPQPSNLLGTTSYFKHLAPGICTLFRNSERIDILSMRETVSSLQRSTHHYLCHFVESFGPMEWIERLSRRMPKISTSKKPFSLKEAIITYL